MITDPARPVRAHCASWRYSCDSLRSLLTHVRVSSKRNAAKADDLLQMTERDIALLDGQLRGLSAREVPFV